jgi:hypothetical protein
MRPIRRGGAAWPRSGFRFEPVARRRTHDLQLILGHVGGHIGEQRSSNIFVFRGTLERYRVHAFNTQNECETALTGLVTRRSITPC